MKLSFEFLKRIFGLSRKHVADVVEKTKSVAVHEAVGSDINFDNTMVPLPAPMSKIKVYFAREAYMAYRECMEIWYNYHKTQRTVVTFPIKNLEKYIIGLDKDKIVTMEDIQILRDSLKPMRQILDETTGPLAEASQKFFYENKEAETVDMIRVNLYAPSEVVQYSKLHFALFKKSRIYQGFVLDYLRRDTNILDRLARLVNKLYADINKTGQGEEYETYRLRQYQLLEILNRYTDYLEEDGNNMDIFVRLSKTPINIKIYEDKDE